MRDLIRVLSIMIFLSVTLTFSSLEANAQTYLPVGPQTDVPVSTVIGGGWTECYRDTYSNNLDAENVLRVCPGSRLLLSCRSTGSTTLTLLAQGDRSDVTFDTGDNSDVLHVANGVGWYFNFVGGTSENRNSWGFVREGDSVDKDNCDIDSSGADNERLCWHLNENGGYRCGATQDLNASEDFERIVYTAGSGSRLSPIPTLSEWGLIATAGILGIIGFIMVIRRRKAAA